MYLLLLINIPQYSLFIFMFEHVYLYGFFLGHSGPAGDYESHASIGYSGPSGHSGPGVDYGASLHSPPNDAYLPQGYVHPLEGNDRN